MIRKYCATQTSRGRVATDHHYKNTVLTFVFNEPARDLDDFQIRLVEITRVSARGRSGRDSSAHQSPRSKAIEHLHRIKSVTKDIPERRRLAKEMLGLKKLKQRANIKDFLETNASIGMAGEEKQIIRQVRSGPACRGRCCGELS